MSDLQTFKNSVRKLNSPRNQRIKNSLGIRDAFLYLQSNKWFDIGTSIREQQFQQIVRGINTLLANEITAGHRIVFPENMGSVEVRKQDKYIRFGENGKIETNYPIDWDATIALWYEDAEAYKNKTLVKLNDNTPTYNIVYNKGGSNYKNKSYFTFRVGRVIQRTLSQNIRNGQIEAYSYGTALH